MSDSVSVVIINYNGGEDLMRCLESLRVQEHIQEIIVADNASTDGSLERARAAFPEMIALPDTVNRGPARAANRGAARATGDILIFLDHDVVLRPGCVTQLVTALSDGDGVVGPVLRSGVTGADEWGVTIDVLGHPEFLLTPRPPFFINRPVFATQRAFFERLGGFDDRFFYTAEELDYCWRAHLAGATVAIVPTAHADHVGGGSTPGGYVRGSRKETTDFRVKLRERYTLVVLIKCAPAWWMTWLIPAYVAKTAVVSAVLLAMGRPRLSGDIMAGLWWNVRELPTTLRLRRTTPRTRQGDLEARRRMYRGLIMLEEVRRYGLPLFVDRKKGN